MCQGSQEVAFNDFGYPQALGESAVHFLVEKATAKEGFAATTTNLKTNPLAAERAP